MIEKLHDILIKKIDGWGEEYDVGQRLPNNKEIKDKINEIIDIINEKLLKEDDE